MKTILAVFAVCLCLFVASHASACNVAVSGVVVQRSLAVDQCYGGSAVVLGVPTVTYAAPVISYAVPSVQYVQAQEVLLLEQANVHHGRQRFFAAQRARSTEVIKTKTVIRRGR